MGEYVEIYKSVLTGNYANFSGRARRNEYWTFTIGNIVIAIALMILSAVFGAISQKLAMLPMILYIVFALGVFLPGLAVCIRRLHDLGKSGWWILISLVPFFGGIILLVLMFMDSQPGENQWGPNPKGM